MTALAPPTGNLRSPMDIPRLAYLRGATAIVTDKGDGNAGFCRPRQEG